MKFHAGICGSYPRPPKLRKAIDMYNKGEISKKELDDIYVESLNAIIKIQENAGLSIISSGLLLWDDLLRPFAKELDGIKLNGLLRFFDNNFYYRVPIIVDKIKRTKSIVVNEAISLAGNTSKLKKLVIPGPFTFIQLSRNEYYGSKEMLVEDLLNALASEAKELAYLVDFLQIDEPSLVDTEISPENKAWGVDLVNELISLTAIPRDKVLIATYFNLDDQSYQLLLDIKAGLHVDMVSTSKSAFHTLREYGFKGDLLSLGLIDGRNIRVENTKVVVNNIHNLLDEIHAKTVVFSTNTWLDYIPFENAKPKIEALGEILQLIRGEK